MNVETKARNAILEMSKAELRAMKYSVERLGQELVIHVRIESGDAK